MTSCWLTTRNQFESLRQAFEQNKLVTVQTKVRSYENMLILDMPHDETPELGTAINVPVRMQEWVEVKPEFGELPPRRLKTRASPVPSSAANKLRKRLASRRSNKAAS